MIYRAGRRTLQENNITELIKCLEVFSKPQLSPPPYPPPPQKKKYVLIVKKMEKNEIWNYQFLYEKENNVGKVI